MLKRRVVRLEILVLLVRGLALMLLQGGAECTVSKMPPVCILLAHRGWFSQIPLWSEIFFIIVIGNWFNLCASCLKGHVNLFQRFQFLYR